MLKYVYALTLIVIIVGCQTNPRADEEEVVAPEGVPEMLPFNTIDLTNLNAFRNPGDNWQIVGEVSGDLETKHSLIHEQGQGVLANIVQDVDNKNLHTKMEHGDLEIHFDVMMPKE